MDITVYKNLLTSEQCDILEEYIDKRLETRPKFFGKDDILHDMITSLVNHFDYISAEVVSMNKDITPAVKHYDKPQNIDTHKLMIYVNGVSGTIFYDDEHNVIFESSFDRGTVVVFNLKYLHSSSNFEGKIKKTCGLRIKLF